MVMSPGISCPRRYCLRAFVRDSTLPGEGANYMLHFVLFVPLRASNSRMEDSIYLKFGEKYSSYHVRLARTYTYDIRSNITIIKPRRP